MEPSYPCVRFCNGALTRSRAAVARQIRARGSAFRVTQPARQRTHKELHGQTPTVGWIAL